MRLTSSPLTDAPEVGVNTSLKLKLFARNASGTCDRRDGALGKKSPLLRSILNSQGHPIEYPYFKLFRLPRANYNYDGASRGKPGLVVVEWYGNPGRD